MKVSLTRKAKALASALLTTLVICSIMSMFVMYYLSLIDQQSYLSARSQVWNMAIAVSEAGVEEGLQQLNANYPTLGTDGWTYDSGSNSYWKSNSLPGGNSYAVNIFITNGVQPIVISRAYVYSIPKYGLYSAGNFFAAVGVSNSTPTMVTRAVQATCAKGNLFTAALVAKKTINLNGNNVTTDSFDSTDPTKSTNGQYDPSKFKGDHGDIASNLGLVDTLSVGNANIYGHAHTGPGSPSNAIQVGNNGVVGSHAWAAANSGIESGWWMPDANFTFPDTTFPNTASYLPPTNGVVVTWSNALTLGSATTYTYPNMPPGAGARTNFGSSTTTTTYPNPVPPGVTTNFFNNVSSFPSPTPSPLLINTNYVINASSSPLAGTYLGTIATTNWNNGKYGTYYSFWQITGYSYHTYTYYTSYTYTPYTTNIVYYTNTYNHILWGTTTSSATNYYVASSLSGSTIVIGQNVVLALPNGLSMSGSDGIILSSGQNVVGATYAPANIAVYSGGTSCAIGGNGVINQPGYAGDFILYCAPTVTSFSLSGNGGFTGILVAPTVDLTMNGGGNNTIDFSGCAMVNSVTMNGHFNFHYDEALSKGPSNGRFLITSWNEVK